jgi:hypothetical protein
MIIITEINESKSALHSRLDSWAPLQVRLVYFHLLNSRYLPFKLRQLVQEGKEISDNIRYKPYRRGLELYVCWHQLAYQPLVEGLTDFLEIWNS